MLYLISLTVIVSCLLPITIIGRQISRLLPCDTNKNIGFFLAPMFGLGILTMTASTYGQFYPFQSNVTLLFLVLITICGFLIERNRIEIIKAWCATALLAVIVTIPILGTALRFDGFNPFSDAFTYLVHGQWLQNHSFNEPALISGHYPANTQVALYQFAGSRMGASFFLGFIQSAYHLEWSYMAYLGVVGIVVTSGCLAFGAIIRHALRTRKKVAFFLCLLPVITPNGFLFGAQGGFLPQTFGLCFAAGLATLVPALSNFVIESEQNFRKLLLNLTPITICFTGFMLTYNDMVAVLAPAIGIFLVVVVVINPTACTRLISATLFVGSMSLIFLNVECVRIFNNFINIVLNAGSGKMSFGWPVTWTPQEFFAYAFGLRQFDILSLPIVFMSVLVCIRIWYQDRRNGTLPFLLCVNFISLLAFIKFRYFSSSPDSVIGTTFLQFKIFKWLSVFDLAILGISGAWVLQKIPRFSVLMKFGFAIVCLIGLLRVQLFRSTSTDMRYFLGATQREASPFELFRNIRERLTLIPKDTTIHINIPSDHYRLKQMIVYFLSDRQLSGKWDDGYINQHLPNDQVDLPMGNATWLLDFKPSRIVDEDPFRRIGPFYIQPIPRQ